MAKSKIYIPKQFEEFNLIIEKLRGQIKELSGVFYKYYESETEPFIESGDFEMCFKILDTWDGRCTEMHKFQLFNIIAEKESKITGEKPRNYHKRYKND